MTATPPREAPDPAEERFDRVVVFTKPARAGEVKTRLMGGEIGARRAAELHAAFLGDQLEHLTASGLEVEVAWALAPDEPIPRVPEFESLPVHRQEGADLGERMWRELNASAGRKGAVAVVGSDHPDLDSSQIRQAFESLRRGCAVVFGPAVDGGYYLVAADERGVPRALFDRIRWSTEHVLAETLARCREQRLEVGLLEPGRDVDTPGDLATLAARLRQLPAERCPRTRRLLGDLGFRCRPDSA